MRAGDVGDARLRAARVVVLLLVGACAGAVPGAAQQRALTLDAIYDPVAKIDFSGDAPTGLAWIDDAHYAWPRPVPDRNGEVEWMRIEALSGRSEPLFDADALTTALAAASGLPAAGAGRLARSRDLTFNATYTAALVLAGGDLYRLDFRSRNVVRLTNAAGDEEVPSFSPDGRAVAFVRAHNLFALDLATGRERALTKDGGPAILNGKLDWVYQEEIYGRGQFRGYWWSPDSTRLAFLRFDEAKVHAFTLVDQLPIRQRVETMPYPKAGDPNPVVTLGVAAIAGDGLHWVDTGKYAGADHLIVKVDWTPDGRQVAFQVQDREQTWLELNLGDPLGTGARTLLRETTGAWVNDHGNASWLEDGSFLWLSERSGFKHLYHHAPDGTPMRPITSGRWEVRVLHGIDREAGVVYFSGTERSAIGLDVYRVRLDGSGLSRLSGPAGTHTATFNPGLTLYIDTWSDLVTPPQVRLHRRDGGQARVIGANPVAALGEYRLSRPELLQVTTRDGFPMEALLIKPPDFDPSRRYPVYQHTYAGPTAQQVKNAWGGSTYLWHQFLAQQGIVVWICDNRSASGKGAEAIWPVYQRLGELELRDIEDGIAWLRRQPWVDGDRIGINGWSYGGFMVSYALTHSKSFVMGIAGGSVTDWRNYDSIYTERFMRMPQHNPEGYRRTAPRLAAADLHGALLLLHGTMDDNVHLSNTMQFAHALQQAGKPFELMLYPDSRHGITDPALIRHMRETMWRFIERTLLRVAAPAETARDRPQAAGSRR